MCQQCCTLTIRTRRAVIGAPGVLPLLRIDRFLLIWMLVLVVTLLLQRLIGNAIVQRCFSSPNRIGHDGDFSFLSGLERRTARMAGLIAPLLAVEKAQIRLLASVAPVSSTILPISMAAGRWTAAPVVARRSQPSRDLSAMDGYAIRFADLPGPFAVIGESAAGHLFAGHIEPGEAVRIFTGAAMPSGADTVIIQEDVTRVAEIAGLSGSGPARVGSNVRRLGLDFLEGDTLIDPGEPLTAARIALLAASSNPTVPVNRLIKVAIIATGDELVPVDQPVADGQLPEANGLMLAAMLADLPVAINDLGIVPDRLDLLVAAFASVDADILVTTGGASVGDHDLVRPALEAAGGTIDFWRMALRPGKPMMAGLLGRTVVLGLPGNPVSAFVTAQLFLRPLIASLGGARSPLPQQQTAVLGAALPANDHRQDYLRGTIRDGRVYAAPMQDSSMLLTLARSTCLIIREPGAPPATAGDMVQILPIA